MVWRLIALVGVPSSRTCPPVGIRKPNSILTKVLFKGNKLAVNFQVTVIILKGIEKLFHKRMVVNPYLVGAFGFHTAYCDIGKDSVLK